MAILRNTSFRNPVVGHLSLLFASALLLGGCGSSLYHLPPPTIAAERAAGEAESGGASAEPVLSEEELDQQARASLLALYALVKKAQFEEAERFLSQETREFLSAAGEVNDPSAVLSSGQFRLQDGRVVQIDPVELLFGGNIVSVQDALMEPDVGETANRRVLYSVDAQGESHRVIMISEGGEWVLHMTSIEVGQASGAP